METLLAGYDEQDEDQVYRVCNSPLLKYMDNDVRDKHILSDTQTRLTLHCIFGVYFLRRLLHRFSLVHTHTFFMQS